MIIQKNSVVTMHYELKDSAGEMLDSSNGQDPLVYMHGSNNIIIGLEEQLEGKKSGDTVTAEITPDKGYGMPVEALVQTVPSEAFGDEIKEVEVGMRFQAETEQGPVPVVVTSIEDGMVTVDGNHPLAGKDLFFDVTITDVR
ncbi:UNVERIFIED_CONTAM: hypothetical protein GTU68_016269, partial [Idotea baltica]|nr:hypothetical protein [Idotea baltica]